MSDGFSFKQFAVKHDRCAMKVGTDGVLIGAWARGGRRLLDIGTGTGLIALMLAQRFAEATVDGLETDAEAVAQARQNIAASPFARRVSIYHTAFQNFTPTTSYDAIVSNPPYFLDNMKNADNLRTMARHAGLSFFHDLFGCCKLWLADRGEVSLVVPAEVCNDIAAEAYLRGFLLSRKIAVRSAPHKPVERILISFVLRRTAEVELTEVCLTEDGTKRSRWYDEITSDFYLQ